MCLRLRGFVNLWHIQLRQEETRRRKSGVVTSVSESIITAASTARLSSLSMDKPLPEGWRWGWGSNSNIAPATAMAHGRGPLTRAVMLSTLPLPVAVLAPRYNFADEDNLPYPVIFRECICHNRRVTWEWYCWWDFNRSRGLQTICTCLFLGKGTILSSLSWS